MALQNGSFTRTNGAAPGTETTYPRFFMDPVEDIIASEQQGRPIFREEERVEIIMAGNPYSKPVHRVTDEHRQRWPKEYDAFKKGQEISLEGMPIEQWSVLKRSMVLELKALGFQTVEQIAQMNDHAMQRIPMFGRRLKELAEACIDDSKAMAIVTKAQGEAEKKDAEIAALRLQVENMSSQMTTLFNQMQAHRDAPNPLATNIPGMSDPVEMAKRGAASVPTAQSSFADLPSAPKRKRQHETAGA